MSILLLNLYWCVRFIGGDCLNGYRLLCSSFGGICNHCAVGDSDVAKKHGPQPMNKPRSESITASQSKQKLLPKIRESICQNISLIY